MGEQSPDLDAALRRLLDREEIRDVLLRYCRASDRGDVDMLRDCYHPDAIDHHGGFYHGDAHGLVDASEQAIASGALPYTIASHLVANMLIEVDGDQAHAETYFISFARRPEGGETLDELVGGRYVDLFTRRDGRWRIAYRTVVYDWARTDKLGPAKVFWDHFDLSGFPFGSMDQKDPLYTLYRKEIGDRFQIKGSLA